MTTEDRRKFLIDIAFYFVIIAIIYLGFKFLSIYLLPFVIGIIVSFLVQKPVKAICNKTKIAKGPLTIVFVVGLYLVFVSVIVLLLYLIYRWISSISSMIPGAMPEIVDLINSISDSVTLILKDLPAAVNDYFNQIPTKLLDAAQSLGISVSNWAIHLVADLPTYIVTIIVTIVASCYIAYDYNKIIRFAKKHIPKNAWNIIVDVKISFSKNVLKMIKSYILLMFITFVELSIGFAIMGINNPVILGAIICVIDILPVLGTGTVLIPWSIISLFTGNILLGIGLIILYVIITIIRNFLEPKIIGNQVGLHPLITLLAMFSGLKIFGIVGLFGFPLALIVITDLNKRGKINFRFSSISEKQLNKN